MERLNRDFKGVWIPKEIWISSQLSLFEKVLFVEINSLDNERHCYAGNKYFADFFGISDRQIRTHIHSLKRKGFVHVSIKNRNEREIRVAGKYARVKDEDLRKIKDDRDQLARNMRVHRPKR